MPTSDSTPGDDLGTALRIATGDRLQPTLLDRLTDQHPERLNDTAAELVISRRQLRQIIMRDLSWLLNATSMASEVDFAHHDHARHSTVNFGLPALSGRRSSEVNLAELQAALQQAIIQFEPRIVPAALQIVGVSAEDAEGAAHNLILFDIRGQIWATPYPIEMLLKSSIDLESGAVTLLDQLGNS